MANTDEDASVLIQDLARIKRYALIVRLGIMPLNAHTWRSDMIILDVTMPVNCYGCPCSYNDVFCMAAGQPITVKDFEEGEERPKWCKIIGEYKNETDK